MSQGGGDRAGDPPEQERPRVVQRPGYRLVIHSGAAVREVLRALLRLLDEGGKGDSPS